jgi:lysophospholipase L1-like esterase
MINYQTITIDLQPDYREPVVQMYLSERDVGRPIQVNVLMQGQPYSFTAGTTVHIDLRKPSGHVVQVNGNYAVGSNVVLFNVVEQMAAEPGMCLTELSIVGDGQDPIGSKNWLTKVELSPLHAGDPSETWIEDLDELVQDAMEGHIDATLSIEGDAADAKAAGDAIAAAVERIPAVDDTLTVSGAAADAAATGTELADLKSATDELEQRVTALDGGNVDLSYDIVENSYVASTNGTIYNYNGWNRTSYISLKDVSKLKINIPQSTVYNYYYKADKSPLENGNLRLVVGLNEVTIPDGAEYLICSGAAASINAMTVENGAEIAEDTNAKIELYKHGNLIDYDNVAVGYIDSTGTPYQSNNIWCTDFCELSGDKVFSYHLVATQYFAFYDENKSKIATWEDTGAMKRYTSSGSVWYLDVPAGAKYFRGTTTYNPATYTTTWASNDPETPNNSEENNVSNAFPYTVNPENPCDYSELTVRAFSKVVCIGDSLTYGGFNLSNSGSATGETQSSAELALRYSYPSNFQRITGIETVNAGDSGETSVSWYEAHQNDDFSGYDLAIIFLGVNDSAFSVPDADTLTAMQNIVTMLNNARSDMRIAICSCIPAYEGAGYQVKGQLILNWAKSLNDPNIIPLDLAQYSHVKPRTSYVAGHCSALGYYMMALDIARYISWYMDQHKRDFRFIQFIGSPDAEWSGD